MAPLSVLRDSAKSAHLTHLKIATKLVPARSPAARRAPQSSGAVGLGAGSLKAPSVALLKHRDNRICSALERYRN